MTCIKKIVILGLTLSLTGLCSADEYDGVKNDPLLNVDYEPIIPDSLTSSGDSFNKDLSGIMKEEDLSFGKDVSSLKAPEYGIQPDDSRTGTADQ